MGSNARPRTNMMKFLVMTLIVAAFVGLSGCTTAVLKLRKDREAEIAKVIQFRSITDVRSGWITEIGTVMACAEFKDAAHTTTKEMAIQASYARLIGKTHSAFNPTPPRVFDPDDVPLYFYPLTSAEKGCEPPPGSTRLPIHSVQLAQDEQKRISEIIRSPEFSDNGSPGLFKISFPVDHDAGTSPPTGAILLVFRPSSDASNPDSFGIPGGYEPGREIINPYTFLLGPAVLVDAAAVTLFIFAWSMGGMT